MLTNIPSNLSELPIYKKAIEIFALSQNISMYLRHDLSSLKSDGTEDANIYFSGDIVQQSVSLAPEIVKAELERFSDKKHKHIEPVLSDLNSVVEIVEEKIEGSGTAAEGGRSDGVEAADERDRHPEGVRDRGED